MRRFRRIAAIALAAAFSLIVVPPALGASGVFGGSTAAREAIVLTTDAKAKKLRSAVIAWEAPCADGEYFPLAIELTAVAAQPGFTPSHDDLVVARNAKGRFAGTQLAIMELGTQVAAINVELSGALRSARASGRLTATVSIFDKATQAEVTTCETGSLKWSATRAAGRIYGGKTTEDEPVVARLDRKGKRVADLLVGWDTDSCVPPERYFRVGDQFSNFVVRSRRFGDTFESAYPTDDGGSVAFAYEVAGTVAKRSIRGSIRVRLTGTDAAGAGVLTCDTGAIAWRASSG